MKVDWMFWSSGSLDKNKHLEYQVPMASSSSWGIPGEFHAFMGGASDGELHETNMNIVDHGWHLNLSATRAPQKG